MTGVQTCALPILLWRLPEKCSRTYRSVHLRPRRVQSTEKTFLDPSCRCSPPSPNCVQPEKCSWTYSGIAPLVGHRRCIPEFTGIMFADLSGIHSESLVESCQPEKCSWSYRGVHLSPRRVESTEKRFMDLSRRCPPPSANCAQPEECSWTYPWIAPLVGHRR